MPLLRPLTATLGLLAVLLIVPATHAQGALDYERSRYNAASYYKYEEAGDVTVLVNVWGTVRNPGLYEVPRGTTMSALLSLAGGPTQRERRTREDRTVTIELLRGEGEDREMIFEAVMDEELFVPENDPIVESGDVLVVDTYLRERFTWRELATLVSTGVSVGILLERIIQTN